MPGFAPYPPPPHHARRWPLYFVTSVGVWFVLTLLLAFLGWMLFSVVYYDLDAYRDARASRHWTAATGKIYRSGVATRTKGYSAFAEYGYDADGIHYEGSRLAFAQSPPVFETAAEAETLLVPFGRLDAENEFSLIFEGIFPKANRDVIVLFDPAAPQNSTLSKEFYASPDYVMFIPGLPFWVFLFVILITSVRTWFRYIGNKEYDLPVRPKLPG